MKALHSLLVRGFSLAAILIAFAGLTGCAHQYSAALFPNGDDWLKWDRFAREQYVSAFVMGFTEGFSRGCEKAVSSLTPPENGQAFLDANARCVGEAPFLGRDLDTFIPSVTAFFQNYPEERRVSVSRVLFELDKGRSIEKIHELNLPKK
jgi:hypothetical protein